MSPAELELAIFQVRSATKLLDRAARLNHESADPDTWIAGQLGRALADCDAAIAFLRSKRDHEVAAVVAEREGEACIFLRPQAG